MNFVKGDTIELEVTTNVSISGWEIRAELYDLSGNSVQIANADGGGSSTQISMDNLVNGVFTMTFPAGETTDFDNDCFLEIERTLNGNVLTIYKGSVKLEDEKITWSTPS